MDDTDLEPLCDHERADAAAFELHGPMHPQSCDVAVVFDLECIPGADKYGVVWQFLADCADATAARYVSHGRFDDPMMSDAALWFSLHGACDGLSQVAPERLRQRFYFVMANVSDAYLWEFEERVTGYVACVGCRVLGDDDAFDRTVKICSVGLTAQPNVTPVSGFACQDIEV